jgi:hypothetical protein
MLYRTGAVRLLQINLAPLEAREPPAAVVVRNGVINPCKTLPLAAGGTLSKTLRTGQGLRLGEVLVK